MECKLLTEQRRLSPGVFNLKQYMNGTETTTWTLDSRFYNGNDLSNYDAFLVISCGGEVDEIALHKELDEASGKIILTWNVATYATFLKGYTKYQIIFRHQTCNGLNVTGYNGAGDGYYNIDNELSVGTGRSWTNSSNNAFKISWDPNNNRWQLKNGKKLEHYQTFTDMQRNEPYTGNWNNILVGNATACEWESDEAIMFISESVAADKSISAHSATILRQVWDGIRRLILQSGVTLQEIEISESDWTGSAAPYELNISAKFPKLPNFCTLQDVRIFSNMNGGGFSDIGNVNVYQDVVGHTKVKSLEKVTGKAVVTVAGLHDYMMVDEAPIEAVLGGDCALVWRDNKIRKVPVSAIGGGGSGGGSGGGGGDFLMEDWDFTEYKEL